MSENKFLNKLIIKKLMLTIGFYFIAWIVIGFLARESPGDSCNPGLGDLAFMALPALAAALFIVNLYETIRGDKSSLPSTLIHFVIVLIMTFTFIS